MAPIKKSRVVAVEVDGLNRTTGLVETLFISDWRYTTKSTDTPAKKPFLAIIESAPVYERYMHGSGRTSGPSVTGTAALSVVNTGKWDFWRDTYEFSGQEIRIYTLTASDVAYSTKTLWLKGFLRTPVFSRTKIDFRIRDRERKVQEPINPKNYLGTGGVEGPEELKGRPVPMTLGAAYGIRGELVDPTFLIFQVHNGPFQAVLQTYDGGYAAAFNSVTTDAATFSALRALSMSSAEVAACYASGYIRLGSEPTYGVTFDVQGDKATSYKEGLSGLLYKSLVSFGPLSAGDLAAGFTATLDAISTDAMGIYLDGSQVDVSEVANLFLQSVEAYRVWDRSTGQISFGRIVVPTTAAVSGIIDTWATRNDLELRPSADENNGIPPRGIRVRHRKQYVNLGGGFAPQTTPAERQRQERDNATFFLSVGSIAADFPDSDILELESLLISAPAASAVAQFVAGIRSATPDFWDANIPTSKFADFDIGSIVLLKTPRYGYTNGKPVLITGMREDLNSDNSMLQLWRR